MAKNLAYSWEMGENLADSWDSSTLILTLSWSRNWKITRGSFFYSMRKIIIFQNLTKIFQDPITAEQLPCFQPGFDF